MKKNYMIRIIIPLTLLLGTATAFFVTAISDQPVTASTDELQSPTSSSVGMYLKIEGIDGESTDAAHDKWIDVIAYSHSLYSDIDMATGGERSTGSVKHSPLRITKKVDKTTPKLYEKCFTASFIPTATLEFWSGGESPKRFFMIELQNVIISSVQGYGTVDDRPTETVSIVYDKIKWTYTEYDLAGNSKGNVESGWLSVSENTIT
ncbi:MAG: Hcp family type VI secretion system effector [Candidatus Hodarchaeales archaeon]